MPTKGAQSQHLADHEYRSNDWWRLPRAKDMHLWSEIGSELFFVLNSFRGLIDRRPHFTINLLFFARDLELRQSGQHSATEQEGSLPLVKRR